MGKVLVEPRSASTEVLQRHNTCSPIQYFHLCHFSEESDMDHALNAAAVLIKITLQRTGATFRERFFTRRRDTPHSPGICAQQIWDTSYLVFETHVHSPVSLPNPIKRD